MDFKTAIVKLLQQRADQDHLFAKTFVKENKSVDECADYILQEVAKMRKNGESCLALSDEEVVNMAVHYFDEDSIKVEKEVKHTPMPSVSTPVIPIKQAKPTKPKWEEGDLFFGLDDDESDDEPEQETLSVEPNNDNENEEEDETEE